MNLLEGMLQKSTITNTKGGEYYASTYDANLDLFSGINRYTDTEKAVLQFRLAFSEDKILATANLLYFLDIRKGKGERKIFKTLFSELCNIDTQMATIVLYQIGNLGRWDYVLEALESPIQENALTLIKSQLAQDENTEHPSLLAKWLPSLRTHNKTNSKAIILANKLNISEKEYRKLLSKIRNKLNLVEHNLTNKDYDNIDFSKVPAKAMLKYRKAFENHCGERYQEYLKSANKGEVKINTNGLFCYEIIEKIRNKSISRELANVMWEQQKDILKGNTDNMLVIADTSNSMTWEKHVYETSIGLALYIAERNHGFFKNYFMRFDTNPALEKVSGLDIAGKVRAIRDYHGCTNIDKVFKLILDTAEENHINQKDMPSHLIIVSDMEFDRGCYSQEGTNFIGWKRAFENKGYQLPKIIFWNVATSGFPVTKYDNDVCMINGFSTSIFENILDLKDFTPQGAMIKSLQPYIEIIEKNIKGE